MRRLYSLLESDPRKFVYLPLKFYWTLIFVLTTIPGNSLPKEIHLSDKVEHMLAYFGLAVLVYLALHFKKKSGFKEIAATTFFIVIFYGAFDELHQAFVPFRDADFLDLLADVFGGIAGIWVMNFFIIFSNKKKII